MFVSNASCGGTNETCCVLSKSFVGPCAATLRSRQKEIDSLEIYSAGAKCRHGERTGLRAIANDASRRRSSPLASHARLRERGVPRRDARRPTTQGDGHVARRATNEWQP